jgi:cellulose biosynthesis protein BcsQ
LTARFGNEDVFKDIVSIPLGTDFRKFIQAAVSRCDVLLAVIGPHWAGDSDASGRRRIDSESDLVRVELEGAMLRGVPVVPVLVDGAQMPTAAELPTGLQELAFRNGTVVRPDPDFDWDMNRLTLAIEQLTLTSDAKTRSQRVAAPAAKLSIPAEVVVVTIMGAKGGVGKSTIACRMAEMIAEKRQNVLLIDLDTGTAGTTTMIRGRVDVPNRLQIGAGRRASVYELLTVIAATGQIPSDTEAAFDVTPNYLTEASDRCGRVYLVPALSGAVASGDATSTLLQRIDARRGRGGPADVSVLVQIIEAAMSHLPEIQCVVIDCGAEGSEFNHLVTEAHALAVANYVVAEPSDVCEQSVHRICHLLSQRPGSNAAEKIRVLANRVISSLDESSIAKRFRGFRIAGCIPDDRRLFEDMQTGRVNHRYGYDSISRAIHDALKNDPDLPRTLVPDELGWIRPLARALVELDPFGHEARTTGKRRALHWAVASILGVLCLANAAWRLIPPRAGTSHDIIRQAQGSAVLLVLIGVGMLGWVGYQWTFWRSRFRLARRIKEIVRSSAHSTEEIEALLIQLSRGGTSEFSLFAWVQDSIRVRQTAAHTFSVGESNNT